MLFGLVVTGKALALGVLMLSLSDRMSFLMGVSYLQSDSFVFCAAVAIALLLLSRFFSSPKNRLALSIFVMIGALTWSAFLLGVSLGYLASYWFVFICGSLGRLTAFVLNMQWNYYYSVSDARDNARTVATTVILAFLVFMLLSMFDGVIAVILLEVALFGSCVLNVAAIRFDMLGRFDAVVEACSHPAETRSYGLIRVLYFAARVCYGLALGFLVGLVSFSGEAARLNNVLAAFASVVFAVCICCILLTSAKSRSNVAFVVALPFFLVAQAFIVFYPGSLTSPLGLFAALSELAWITQNIFQLPTYRRMTGMNAGAFTFVDYGCQMVPFYLCAWFVMKLGPPLIYRAHLHTQASFRDFCSLSLS